MLTLVFLHSLLIIWLISECVKLFILYLKSRYEEDRQINCQHITHIWPCTLFTTEGNCVCVCVCPCACVRACACMHVCSDLGVVSVLESQAKVVPLQQVQMATHHVQQGLALGKFLLHTHTYKHIRTHSERAGKKVQVVRTLWAVKWKKKMTDK